MNQWLQNLNPEQQEAVLHNHGPMLILAGAGSGKTTVLVSRTGRLIDEKVALADQILVLTFTNKAARELKERVAHKIGPKAKKIWAGTFHSFGLKILKENIKLIDLPKGFGVIDAADSRQILKELIKNIKVATKDSFDVEFLLELINQLRSGQKLAPDIGEDYADLAKVLVDKYVKRLRELGVVDFESLLLDPLALFKKHPDVLEKYQNQYQQIMVDEFQDTNEVQMKLVKALSQRHHNISVVGDDDQSIYGWRGACISNILDFPKLYKNCHVVKLERNYRSSSMILKLANEVIKKNSQRHDKVLKPEKAVKSNVKPEVFVHPNEDQEVEQVVQEILHFQRQGYTLDQIAVLYRSNSQGALLEGALRRAQVDYELTGGTTFFERVEVKDVMAYLRCAVAPHEVSYRRILNTPARGIGDGAIEKIEIMQKEQDLSIWKVLPYWKEIGLSQKQGDSISRLQAFLEKIPSELVQSAPGSCGDALSRLMIEIGYRDHVWSSYRDPQVAEGRWGLVEIVGRILDGFFARGERSKKTIKEFIESIELRDKLDEDDSQTAKVQLLTLHASKGLEFPVVIIMGIEEDILPHRMLGQDINEERRLFYVGVTRAQERLILTRAKERKRHGKVRPSTPSRFLEELPRDLFTFYELGFRPVSEGERTSMLADLFKKIDQGSEARKLKSE